MTSIQHLSREETEALEQIEVKVADGTDVLAVEQNAPIDREDWPASESAEAEVAKPRILHFSSSYFPRIGGLPSTIREIAHQTSDVFEHFLVTRDLVRAGLTTERYRTDEKDDSDPNITVYRFRSDGEYLTAEMRKFIASFPHDVLMIHSTNPHLLEAAAITNARVLFAPQCKTRLELGENLSRVDRILALLPSHRAHFVQEHKVPEDKIVVFPRLVDVDKFARKRRKGSHLMLYTGRISPGKRVWLLVEMLAKLRKADKAYRLQIVGDYDHPSRDEPALVSAAIAVYKMQPYVTISRPSADLAAMDDIIGDAHDLADIAVSASRSETFGHSLLEAVACGLPVVTTAEGECREWAAPYVHFVNSMEEMADVIASGPKQLSLAKWREFRTLYSWQARKAEFVEIVRGVL